MSTENSKLMQWLLSGDVSIQYQTKRDLLELPESEIAELQLQISENGWGKQFLDKRNPETGLWGNGIYSPKWISTHYTLLDLKNIGVHPSCVPLRESSEVLLSGLWHNKGMIRKDRYQDLCVSAMAVNICCYFNINSDSINEIIDYLLEKQYPDGGWNCNWDKGDKHSSVHSTLSVLEAFYEYQKGGYLYRIDEIKSSLVGAWEFLLKKHLFKSVHSGEIIDKRMIMLSFPCRWKYDILRCLDYFQLIDKSYDSRMDEALDIVIRKKKKNNRWTAQQKYPGLVHFDMEKTSQDSRWNTLRALRVLRKYKQDFYKEIIEQ